MVGEECCVTTLKTAAKETPGDSVPLCCWPPRGLCRDLDEPSSQGPLLPVSLTPLGGVGEGPGNEVAPRSLCNYPSTNNGNHDHAAPIVTQGWHAGS